MEKEPQTCYLLNLKLPSMLIWACRLLYIFIYKYLLLYIFRVIFLSSFSMVTGTSVICHTPILKCAIFHYSYTSLNYISLYLYMGFPGGTSGKELACQCRRYKRHGFDPWVGMICWRRAWQPTSVFWPEESHGQRSLASYSPWGHREWDTTEVTEHVHIYTYT